MRQPLNFICTCWFIISKGDECSICHDTYETICKRTKENKDVRRHEKSF